MTNQELARGIKNGMFSSRESIDEAYDYATKIFMTFKEGEYVAALTALHVVMNTIGNQITENERILPDTLVADNIAEQVH